MLNPDTKIGFVVLSMLLLFGYATLVQQKQSNQTKALSAPIQCNSSAYCESIHTIISNCSDGTRLDQCSTNEPYYCSGNLKLIRNSSACGCPVDYYPYDNACAPSMCNDGTRYNNCSISKPLYCDNGTLVNKSSECGCGPEETESGEACISKFYSQPINETFNYVLYGNAGNISWVGYQGLDTYLESQSNSDRNVPTYTALTSAQSNEIVAQTFVERPEQYNFILEISNAIENVTNDRDAQVIIATSIVQHIPYDDKFAANLSSRVLYYPYDVLIHKQGICQEKSTLLALLLKQMGFDTVLFSFVDEDHMAVGVRCQTAYSFQGTGYCFIETTVPAVITDSSQVYGPNQLGLTTPDIVHISNGSSFDATWVSSDYAKLDSLRTQNTPFVGDQRDEWETILSRYGITDPNWTDWWFTNTTPD